jgi:hypothetical protein
MFYVLILHQLRQHVNYAKITFFDPPRVTFLTTLIVKYIMHVKPGTSYRSRTLYLRQAKL